MSKSSMTMRLPSGSIVAWDDLEGRVEIIDVSSTGYILFRTLEGKRNWWTNPYWITPLTKLARELLSVAKQLISEEKRGGGGWGGKSYAKKTQVLILDTKMETCT
jgi:hypothetical protein